MSSRVQTLKQAWALQLERACAATKTRAAKTQRNKQKRPFSSNKILWGEAQYTKRSNRVRSEGGGQGIVESYSLKPPLPQGAIKESSSVKNKIWKTPLQRMPRSSYCIFEDWRKNIYIFIFRYPDTVWQILIVYRVVFFLSIKINQIVNKRKCDIISEQVIHTFHQSFSYTKTI